MIISIKFTEVNPYNSGEFAKNEKGQTVSTQQAVADVLHQITPAMEDHIREVILMNYRNAVEGQDMTLTLRIGE